MAQLDKQTYTKIEELCRQGDGLAENENYSGALDKYWQAYDLVPEPKNDWEATTWILTAIGDANFMNADYQAAVENLSGAMHCPQAIGNPYIHLRLGESQYEVGNLDRAADELTRAYAIAGEEIFEHENPMYFEFLKTRIDISPPKKKSLWRRITGARFFFV